MDFPQSSKKSLFKYTNTHGSLGDKYWPVFLSTTTSVKLKGYNYN